jgi:hypothetical protein
VHFKRKSWLNQMPIEQEELERKPCHGEDERRVKSALGIAEFEKKKGKLTDHATLRRFFLGSGEICKSDSDSQE